MLAVTDLEHLRNGEIAPFPPGRSHADPGWALNAEATVGSRSSGSTHRLTRDADAPAAVTICPASLPRRGVVASSNPIMPCADAFFGTRLKVAMFIAAQAGRYYDITIKDFDIDKHFPAEVIAGGRGPTKRRASDSKR